MLGAVLAGVLVVVVVAAGIRLRALGARGAALEAERDRLATDGEGLRARLAQTEGTLQEVRESEASYRALVDGAADWVWASDSAGTITFSNAAGSALLGHEELVGRTLEEFTHRDDQVALTAPQGWAGVIRRRHADGRWLTVDTRSVPVLDGGGQPAGWRGIDRDLTAPPPPARTPRPLPDAVERPGVAVVRWPVVDGRREVVGYELVGDGSVLGGFAPDELIGLGGGRPVWVSLDVDAVPDVARDRAVLQIGADADPERARALAAAGYALALDDFSGSSPLLDHCGIVKVRAPGREDDELRALIGEPAERGLVLVATGVATPEEFTRCQVLGFSHFQGEFFARPRGEGRTAGQGAVASMQALAELTAGEGSFEDLERIIGADVGLSIALLRYVNSAFFALPRKIDTVREALTLLGTRAVRRWATVVALSAVGEVPDQLVALALLRARMCELLGRGASEEERDRLFTVGLFSVADALLDAPMEEVLASLPFSEEISGALLRYEGRRGRVLAQVLRYEQGHFPEGAEGDPIELAEAYLTALRWADDAGRWIP
jgi:EAL and modified HD-GYP domain-containing signal transduction protein